MRISETDLILNNDGSVYHLNLLPKHLAKTIIAVGDPDRVQEVSKYFDKIEFEINKREFITHTGTYKGKRVSAISTGIGTDNVEIFMTELDALVNVDLKTRKPKAKKTSLKIVRVGTSGALQKDIPLDAHLASVYGVGLDNLLQFYKLPMTAKERNLAQGIQRKSRLLFTPYVAKCSTALLKQFGFDMIQGNTVTSPGFYAPQGRSVRSKNRYPSLLDDLGLYQDKKSGFRLTNFEMETAAYYALGKLLGHEMLSLNAIVANRALKKFSKQHHETIDSLIRTVLDRI